MTTQICPSALAMIKREISNLLTNLNIFRYVILRDGVELFGVPNRLVVS